MKKLFIFIWTVILFIFIFIQYEIIMFENSFNIKNSKINKVFFDKVLAHNDFAFSFKKQRNKKDALFIELTNQDTIILDHQFKEYWQMFDSKCLKKKIEYNYNSKTKKVDFLNIEGVNIVPAGLVKHNLVSYRNGLMILLFLIPLGWFVVPSKIKQVFP